MPHTGEGEEKGMDKVRDIDLMETRGENESIAWEVHSKTNSSHQVLASPFSSCMEASDLLLSMKSPEHETLFKEGLQ